MERATTEPFSRSETSTLSVPRARGAKLRHACRGLKLGIRGRASFSALFFFAALIAAAAIALRCELLEWCLLTACVGAALAAEFFYCALEAAIRSFEQRAIPRAVPALDIAASALLIVRIFAGCISALILLNHLPLS